MNQREIDGFMKALAPVIGAFVVKAIEPLQSEHKRLAEEVAALRSGLDALPAPAGEDVIARLVDERVAKIPPVEPGKDAETVAALVDKAAAALDDIGPQIEAAVRNHVAALPKAITLDEVRPAIDEAVARCVAELPPAEPGKSVTVEDVAPVIDEAVAKAVAAIEVPAPDMALIGLMIGEKVEAAVAQLPPAEEGKSVTVEDVRPLLEEMVAALPPPEPGKSVTVEELAPLVEATVEKAVAALPVRDPVGLAGALIDREGHLVVTLSDGATKALGRVVGTNGADVDMDVVRSTIKDAVEALPKPRDGIDGVGFDDMDLVEEDGDLFLRFTRGEVVKDFLLPVTTDRGVWVEKTYRKGAGVSWGGSYWIAQRETSAKPETPDSGWRLAVKKGRNGPSAYDVACKAGFKGSEREWLDSLRPKPVQPVKVN